MSNDEKQPLIRRHIGLKEVLQLATPDELLAISEILLNKTNDRLLGDDSARQRLAECFVTRELYKVVDEIAFEIRALGSVSLASLLRKGEPVSYDEVVRDVASELKAEFNKTDSTAAIEEKVLATLVEKLAEQEAKEVQAASAGWFRLSRLSSSVSTLLGPLNKLGLGATGAGLFAAGTLVAMPLATIGAIAAGALVFKNKNRPELEGLATIVVHVARIRAGIVAADHEDFANRLKACL